MKRTYSSLLQSSKRSKSSTELDTVITAKVDNSVLRSDTYIALTHLIDQSKAAFITHRIPPLYFKHQLYNLVSSRTNVDRDIQKLFELNTIRLFHSDLGDIIMFTDDYRLLIEAQFEQLSLSTFELKQVTKKFLSELLPNCFRLSIDRDLLDEKYDLKKSDIQLLIQLGVLLVRDIDHFWFSVPNIAKFISVVKRGRRMLLHTLRMRKYREIPLNELKERDMKKQCLFGFDYHLNDLIGSNLATIIDTPTGSVVKFDADKS
ncbi:unnamed protein product [Didymodactylos carnosus]|uniref:Uncharacterized protein n=1 Tax=Didymodactylos carnosus TaxID=1234261 RepID=A0A813SVX9_9BILA|nr:unnamed protein product [Didymodactylos carnosus]CAF0801178.1 unnamed protein product [Didymodactylos carnosus]CAF3528271.1 unnamed protein product [Didymodactylos carnosus]CAF3586358.1 unnamed protein product [Didymodactylos carnosus]